MELPGIGGQGLAAVQWHVTNSGSCGAKWSEKAVVKGNGL